MKALVLGGGSIKGGYQAGAIHHVVSHGFVPDIITGISVGALNTAGLAAFGHDWLRTFWLTTVTRPSDIATKRPWYELAYRVIAHRWDGVVRTDALDKLVRATFHGVTFSGTPKALVGCVPLSAGQIVYVPSTDPDFIDAVLASAAEPFAMPLRPYNGQLACDGGIIDITPLSQAIHQGADEIIAIVCQPAGIAPAGNAWGNVSQMVGRDVSIVEANTLENDLKFCGAVNQMVQAGIAPGKRHVSVTVIRPEAPLPIDIMNFTARDIAATLAMGEADARKVWPLALPEAA